MKYIGIAVGALVIGMFLGAFLFGGNGESATSTSEVAQANEVWTCSMHPQIRQPEPGDCPICGMDLIQLKTDHSDSGSRAIRMSPTAMQLADVRTSIVGTKSSARDIVLNGKVRFDQRYTSTQSSHFEGRLESLAINFVGEKVRRGQTIASVYSPDLVTAQQELLEAEKIKTLQPALFEAAKQKLRIWKLSEAQIEAILETKTPSVNFKIFADQSGIVTKQVTSEGDYVRRGQPLFETADLTRLWLTFDLHENDLKWISIGDSLIVTVPSFPGLDLDGIIDFIDPIIDQKTRVAQARMSVRNNNGKLKPDMLIKGALSSPISTAEDKIVVPKTAVMWTGKRSIVYVKQTDDTSTSFVLRQVELGADLGNSFIIDRGLEVGEEIVTHGTFSVDAAAQLAGKPSMMNPEGGAQTTGHNHGEQPTRDSSGPSAVKHEVDEEATAALEKIYESYFSLKNALAGDDFTTAQKASTTLKEKVESTDMQLFQGDAHTTWMTQQEQLLGSLAHVEHMGTIAELRDQFIQISKGLIGLAEAFGASKTIYVDFCPMADDNKGASWLSEQEEVLNPYFGKQMLKCGKVTNTIE